MTDKWDMCMVGPEGITIWSPEQPVIELDHKGYAQLLGKETKGTGYFTTITYLLESGWEPYTSVNLSKHFLRRKLSS